MPVAVGWHGDLTGVADRADVVGISAWRSRQAAPVQRQRQRRRLLAALIEPVLLLPGVLVAQRALGRTGGSRRRRVCDGAADRARAAGRAADRVRGRSRHAAIAAEHLRRAAAASRDPCRRPRPSRLARSAAGQLARLRPGQPRRVQPVEPMAIIRLRRYRLSRVR